MQLDEPSAAAKVPAGGRRIIQGHKVMPRGEEEGGKEGGEWQWEEDVAWGREMEGREGERAKQKVTD